VIGCLARPVLKVSIKIECQEINQSIDLKHKECQEKNKLGLKEGLKDS